MLNSDILSAVKYRLWATTGSVTADQVDIFWNALEGVLEEENLIISKELEKPIPLSDVTTREEYIKIIAANPEGFLKAAKEHGVSLSIYQKNLLNAAISHGIDLEPHKKDFENVPVIKLEMKDASNAAEDQVGQELLAAIEPSTQTSEESSQNIKEESKGFLDMLKDGDFTKG